MRSRRVYSETLPYEELVRPRTLRLLARYELELVLAVRPWDEGALPDIARALRDAGIPLSIWPMLSDDRGRWASIHNAQDFAHLTRSVCDRLEAAGAPPREVLFDLEPPFAQARSLAAIAAAGPRVSVAPAPVAPKEKLPRLGSGLPRSSSSAYRTGSRELARAASELHERAIATSMAVWPLVALDPPGENGWQGLLGTPVDALGTGHVSVMMYTSILEGWSRGALRRRDTTALLAAATVRTVDRWGPKAGISVGCVGTGAFEDEPVYRDPAELAEDVAIARTSGCERLTLFDLGGVLTREPAEAWLDAFVFAEEAICGPASKRVRAARVVARAATWALGRAR